MSDPVAKRESLALEFFELTGEALPDADPIITGAVFFSHKLGEAGRAAAGDIEDAAQRGVVHVHEASRAAAQEMREASRRLALDANEVSIRVDASTRAAEIVIERMAAERAQLLRTI